MGCGASQARPPAGSERASAGLFVSTRRTSDETQRQHDPQVRYREGTALMSQLQPVSRSSGDDLIPVRLLRASWLIKQGNAQRQNLPRRKALEEAEPEAYLESGELEEVLNEVTVAAKHGTAVMLYPPIIVLSYPWRTPEHPDPSGSLLAMLALQLEWYVSERARLAEERVVVSHDCGVFIDYWCLYQFAESSWERAVFDSALMSMDVWYGHAGTVTLLMTRPPADWGELPCTRQHGGRGWCFFERSVSSLAKVSTHVLDGGRFDHALLAEEHPNAAAIGDGAFERKSRAALSAQATGEDRGDHRFLASLIMGSRPGPLHPERISEALASRAFSHPDDRARVTRLYQMVADSVLRSTSHTSFSHTRWTRDDFANCGYTLTLCKNLIGMRLNNSGMDAAAMRALLEPLSNADLPSLTELHLKDNPLGESALPPLEPRAPPPRAARVPAGPALTRQRGAPGSEGFFVLANALQAGRLPRLRLLLLRDNGESDFGRLELEQVCKARRPPVTVRRSGHKNWEVHSTNRKSTQRNRLGKLRRATDAWRAGRASIGLVELRKVSSTETAAAADSSNRGGSPGPPNKQESIIESAPE